MWKLAVFVLLSCTALVEPYQCGTPVVKIQDRQSAQRGHNRIVGGWEAKPHSFPWQVRVQNHKYGNMYSNCGGSLVQTTPGDSADLVLTAAHCLEEYGKYPDASRLTVVVGAHDLDDLYEPTQKRIKVVDYSYGPFDTKTKENDIALLRLEQAVKISNVTIPVCLPKENEDPRIGMTCYAAGWGTLYEGGRSTSRLQQVDLDILDQNSCKGVKNPTVQFCAGTLKGGRDTCQGDSGGPLVCESGGRYIQYGVVSFGAGCAKYGYPGVYTRLSNFMNWLQSQSKYLKPSSGIIDPNEKPAAPEASMTTGGLGINDLLRPGGLLGGLGGLGGLLGTSGLSRPGGLQQPSAGPTRPSASTSSGSPAEPAHASSAHPTKPSVSIPSSGPTKPSSATSGGPQKPGHPPSSSFSVSFSDPQGGGFGDLGGFGLFGNLDNIGGLGGLGGLSSLSSKFPELGSMLSELNKRPGLGHKPGTTVSGSYTVTTYGSDGKPITQTYKY